MEYDGDYRKHLNKTSLQRTKENQTTKRKRPKLKFIHSKKRLDDILQSFDYIFQNNFSVYIVILVSLN